MVRGELRFGTETGCKQKPEPDGREVTPSDGQNYSLEAGTVERHLVCLTGQRFELMEGKGEARMVSTKLMHIGSDF